MDFLDLKELFNLKLTLEENITKNFESICEESQLHLTMCQKDYL